MRLGVVFPSYEIGNDPGLIRDFAQAAEELGYTHLVVYDHVLGVDPNRPGGWSGRYSKDQAFHEPFVLMGYIAAVTQEIEMVTGVLVLPQRQTALVAKQAAEVAVLARGRLRLGVGVGWNDAEFEALGMNFHDRGRREEEQIDVLRKLWENDIVDYSGQWHRVNWAGINPRPPGAVPIWLGGNHELTMKRAARLAEGWFQPQFRPGDADSLAKRERLHGYLRDAGRDPATFGIEGWVNYDAAGPERWRADLAAWEGWGATHASVRTFDCGLARPEDHLDAIRRYREGVVR
jgi:probable F420-dependent oxidoreductase